MGTRAKSFLRFFLIAALAYGVGVRFLALTQWKQGFSYDESLSYLVAAATEGRYEREIPALTDTVITAGVIQAFYKRPTEFQFSLVAHDLVHYDGHPPLYYWVLHAQYFLFGNGFTGGLWLNVIAGLLALLLLYALARDALGSTTAALATCVIWYLSPAVVQADLEARQYEFWALLALASYLLSWRIADRGVTTGRLALFMVVNALGFLTHYFYGFILLPGLWLIWRRYRFTASAWRYVGSLVLSVLLFLLAFPQFLEFLGVLSQRMESITTPPTFLDGAKTLLYSTLGFFAAESLLRYAYILIALAAGTLLVLRMTKHKHTEQAAWPSAIQFVWVALAWCVAFTLLFYFARVTPTSFVGQRYFAYLWPLLAIAVVHAARLLLPERVAPWVLAGYVGVLGFSFTAATKQPTYIPRMVPPAWRPVMDAGDLLVVDDKGRGFLPRTVRGVRPDMPLYLMQGSRPDVEGLHRVTAIHRLRGKGAAADRFAEWMEGQGFRPTEERHIDTHVMRTYVR